jgi:hypothetical protein
MEEFKRKRRIIKKIIGRLEIPTLRIIRYMGIEERDKKRDCKTKRVIAYGATP